MSARLIQLVTHIDSKPDLLLASEAKYNEVLLGHAGLSTLGTLDKASIEALAQDSLSLGIRPVLLWDTLMTDPDIDQATLILKSLNLSLFSAIRVQDPGALEYALENTVLPIQLILKAGNHNFQAIHGWCTYAGTRLERAILSSELPKARIAEYIQMLPAPVELLGLGPILLLYTPRKLLTYRQTELSNPSSDSDTETEHLEAIANCEENGQKGFRIHETVHGTLMFHPKDYCLVDRYEELKEIKLGAFQVDLRLEKNRLGLLEISKLLENYSEEHFNEWANQHSAKLIRCFFQANATDVLFKKLKNTTTQRIDKGGIGTYLGDVVEAQKKNHLVIQVRGKNQKIKRGQKLTFVTPTKKVIEMDLKTLKNLNQESIEEAQVGDFVILPYVSAVTPTTVVYHEQ